MVLLKNQIFNVAAAIILISSMYLDDLDIDMEL